jgi:hypothetical protein
VQHPFVREVETIFAGNKMHGEIAFDGQKVFSMFHFTNIVNDKDITDPYGQVTVGNLLKRTSKHKAFIESFGIYKMRNARGTNTPAMTFFGLKTLLSRLPGKASDKYMVYCIEMTTRIERGDRTMFDVILDSEVSLNMVNVMARETNAQQRASGGVSIAQPSEQVLATRMVCFCCTCSDFRPALQVSAAQGETQVAMRLEEQGVFILDKAQAQMYLQTDAKRADAEVKRADAEKTKAEKMVSLENNAQRAHESSENNAQRAHELKMKEVRKLELKVELAKLQAQNPTTAPTKQAKAGVGKPKKRKTAYQIEQDRIKRKIRYEIEKKKKAGEKEKNSTKDP